jgi:hypothetical protein
MDHSQTAVTIRQPRNTTALMQLLQLFISKGYLWWCGGRIRREKLNGFVQKMTSRYPLERSVRGRAYDKTRGVAVMHLVLFPVSQQDFAWWILSSAGRNGLADSAAPDHCVAVDASSSVGHVTYGDYVLHYATKKASHRIKCADGTEKIVLKDCSTWTWKMTDRVFNKSHREIEALAVKTGAQDGEKRVIALRRYLNCQRSRPLFAGVRNQVIELHRVARDRLARSGGGSHEFGEETNGCSLTDVSTVIRTQLPKMRRIKLYNDALLAVKDKASPARAETRE